MKRDMNLIREILLHIEGEEKEIDLETEQKTLDEHIALLIDSGYINGFYERMEDREIHSIFSIIGLTWEGYELLEVFRNKSILTKALSVLKPIGSFAIPIIRELCTTLIKNELNLQS